jgi:TnpA family transposase
MLRVAGSLKLGWVTASLFIAKLQSFRRQNVLTRTLQEYGRLNKTIFILRYLLDEPYQRRIGAQINKGEALHALLSPARYAHINPYGKYRFNVEGEFHRKGLRPLRQPDSALA